MHNLCLIIPNVEKLYPSIQPQLALLAIKETFSADKPTENKTKQA